MPALVAGDSIFVRGGQTYTDNWDIDASVYVRTGPKTVFSGTFGQTVAKSAVLFGNGSSTGVYTMSADDCWMKARNGLDTTGMVVSGARCFHDGGGFGTKHDGGTAAVALTLSAADCIFQNATYDTTTGATGERTIDLPSGSNADRYTIRTSQVIDSEEHGVFIESSNDGLLEGVHVLGSDGQGFWILSPRTRMVGCQATGVGGIGTAFGSTGDNSVGVGNVIEAAVGDEWDLHGLCENVTLVANRIFGTIDDNSATSTVKYNDLGTITCTVTGTWQSAAALESEIVAGGKTLILTLANGVWQNIAMTNALWAPFFSGNHSEANDWDNEEATILADAAIVRTSDTVVTITLAAAANYAITTTDEIVTLTALNGTVLASDSTVTPDDVSFTITEGS